MFNCTCCLYVSYHVTMIQVIAIYSYLSINYCTPCTTVTSSHCFCGLIDYNDVYINVQPRAHLRKFTCSSLRLCIRVCIYIYIYIYIAAIAARQWAVGAGLSFRASKMASVLQVLWKRIDPIFTVGHYFDASHPAIRLQATLIW